MTVPKEAGKPWQGPGTLKWTVTVDLWRNEIKDHLPWTIPDTRGKWKLHYAWEWGSTMITEVRSAWQRCDKRSHRERWGIRHEYNILPWSLNSPKGLIRRRTIFWTTTEAQTGCTTKGTRAMVQHGNSKSRSCKFKSTIIMYLYYPDTGSRP
jgi:hypothetical protein